MTRFTYERGAQGSNLEAVEQILHTSFGVSRSAASDRWRTLSPDLLRVLFEDGELVATLAMLPMGHWFGGRCVPAGGVNGVGVGPEHRGAGRARRIMERALRELHEDGVPISSLYPANDGLYRQLGYERAGARWEAQLPVTDLRIEPGPLALRRVEGDVRAAVEPIQEEFAGRNAGNARRCDLNWWRVLDPPGQECNAYVVESTDGPEGYVVLWITRDADYRIPLNVTDWAALSGAAGRRILALLASHSGLGAAATWFGSPWDPLVMGLPEMRARVRVFSQWMLRVVDVPKALEARGWPSNSSGRLQLWIEDPLLPENDGSFVLEVADGEARVEPGGDGSMRLPVRALAPLYSGWLTARQLVELGWIEADPESIAAADRLFAGERPWMIDVF